MKKKLIDILIAVLGLISYLLFLSIIVEPYTFIAVLITIGIILVVILFYYIIYKYIA